MPLGVLFNKKTEKQIKKEEWKSMGRGNPKYHKTLHQQAYDKLQSLTAYGQSKHEAKKTGVDKEKIYSYSTYKTYKQWVFAFTKWEKENHPEVTTLKKAKRHVGDYLQSLVDNGSYSASTIATATAALNKIYQMAPNDPQRFTPPERHRADITRSRNAVEYDRHFSEANNRELVNFAQATGARRAALEKLTGADLYTVEQLHGYIDKMRDLVEQGQTLTKTQVIRLNLINDTLKTFPNESHFVYFDRDKGGRCRYAPIIGEHKQDVIDRFNNTGRGEKVWLAVPKAMDVHSYRSDYATALYRAYARPIDTIPYDKTNKGSGQKYQSGVYHCRGDLKGVSLDKAAMQQVSKALGHNRLEVVASHYLRGI